MMLIPWWARAFVVALLFASAAGWGAMKMHAHDRVAYEKLERDHAAFVAATEARGMEAAAAAARQRLADLKDKERTDDENRRTHAADLQLIARMRADAAARDSRGGSVPPAPAGSDCPEGQTCFDRAEYQRAMGAADAGARRLADEGTSVTIDLDSAKRWAQSP